ncbi:5-formyltetrahydrofolate cyclo-ligase, putative [Trichophyton verrucosum HKI 0517]|uniref:5-formyltetrahydrofolate cyclo-ligase n=1 Tax=Trichophyton verrucosum (strain HKI 0517) TaxID=663202 RepID=D4D573_TRIVH|nr:5-formyltetrahydrofolate cyclo-ligase, putative [Trichophyton verrucosum HKI 0517]EFE42993.1 5-formyltetrahydrofolate cyclo-ligase, putative [Trichophyton verrucosum HKI 0517]
MPAGELRTGEIVRDAFRRGKQVFVPYIYKLGGSAETKPSSIMEMLALRSLEDYESLQPDGWGIPTLDASSVAGRENCLGGNGLRGEDGALKGGDGDDCGLDFIVVPGMAFDHGRRRLGHGKGYYDRFINRYRSNVGKGQMPYLAAFCLAEQVLQPPEEVPVGEYDNLVDSLVRDIVAFEKDLACPVPLNLPTKLSPGLFLRLRSQLDLDRVVHHEVHELVKALVNRQLQLQLQLQSRPPGVEPSAYPYLPFYAHCQLLVQPYRDRRPLLQELEDEMDRSQQRLRAASLSSAGHGLVFVFVLFSSTVSLSSFTVVVKLLSAVKKVSKTSLVSKERERKQPSGFSLHQTKKKVKKQ